MSNLKRKLCDANNITVMGVSYKVLSHDPQQMHEQASEVCLYTKEEDVNFSYVELLEAEESGQLYVYTLQLWDNIRPSTEELEEACEENFAGSEIITYIEAMERWSLLTKYETQAKTACLKLRCLGQTQDAQDLLTRATNAEYLNAKKANVATQLMNAMQRGREVVFYEWADSDGSVCKGGRYGTEPSDYASFYL